MSSEHPCRPYCSTAGSPWWLRRVLIGFVESPSPSLEAFEDEDDDGDSDDDDDENEDASSSSEDTMSV